MLLLRMDRACMGISSPDIDSRGEELARLQNGLTKSGLHPSEVRRQWSLFTSLLRPTVTLILDDQQSDYHILCSTCAKFFPLPSSLQIMP